VKHSTQYALGTCFGLLLAFSVAPGRAQDQPKMKATIPFTFVVGSKELKAGEYLIQQVGSPGSQSLQFRSEDGDFEQTALTMPIETNKIGNHERLVFHRYGDQYFLSQVWVAGDDGREFIAGPEKRRRQQKNRLLTKWLSASNPVEAKLVGKAGWTELKALGGSASAASFTLPDQF
jgi:hypothetical protein